MDEQARAFLVRTQMAERIQEAERDRLARALRAPKHHITRPIQPLLRGPWPRSDAPDRSRTRAANPIANGGRVQGGMALGL